MAQLDPEELKIPAFQRKRSLAQRARHPIAWTAQDRQKKALERDRDRSLRAARGPAASASRDVSRDSVVDMPRSSFSSESGTYGVQLRFDEAVSAQGTVRGRRGQRNVRDESSDDAVCRTMHHYRLVGTVSQVFGKISVAAITLQARVKKGDMLLFEFDEGMFEQIVESMQINHRSVRSAKAGSDIGIKTMQLPRAGGRVYARV